MIILHFFVSFPHFILSICSLFPSLLLSRTNKRFSNAYAILLFLFAMTECQSFIKLSAFPFMHKLPIPIKCTQQDLIYSLLSGKFIISFQSHSNTFKLFRIQKREYFTYTHLLSRDINNLFARILLPYLLPTPFR